MKQKVFYVTIQPEPKSEAKKTERLSIETVLIALVWVLVLVIFTACITVDVYRQYEPSQPTQTEEATPPADDSIDEPWMSTAEIRPEVTDTPEAALAKLIAEAQAVDRPANPWGVPLMDDELVAVHEVCQEWHFSEELALALIWEESRFDRKAVNVDCYGLCQLKERYFPGAKDMTGVENIRAGLTYLGKLLEKYDSMDAALTAYRWGHDNGDRTYATEVIDRLMYYGGMFGE